MSDVKLSSRLRVASILTEPEETSRLLENAANRIEELERELATAKAEQRDKDALYFAVNNMMAHLGAYGEIDPTGTLADAVMNALFDIDGGNAIERGE